MYTDHEILVKRSDLLPIDDEGEYYLVDNIRHYKSDGAEYFRGAAMRHLTVATRMADDAAKVAAQEAAEWELEHAVPLARKMHDTFHKYSDQWRDSTAEELWLHNYKERNHLVLKWVATASAALKAQEGSK